MIRLKVKNNYFKVLYDYRVSSSSREVKFSSLTLDFTNKTIADLPLKYQEVQLLELNDDYSVENVIYTGFVNNFILPKMKNAQEYRELEIDLLSPLAMATIRTTDAVGTYNLQPLIKEIIQPLINDGFVLKEFNITNNQATINFMAETVESALNKLSNKYNFWWYIDENKNIYINSISYLMSLKAKLTYNDKLDGLIDFIPSIDATDYCNTITFTNVRLYQSSIDEKYENMYDEEGKSYHTNSYPLFIKDYIYQGDKIEFNYPIDISLKGYERVENVNGMLGGSAKNFLISGKVNNQYFNLVITKSNETGQMIIPASVSIDDTYSDINTWVLVRDVFFKNLIVGLQYNGTDTIDLSGVSSSTALIWTKVKYYDNLEINKNKGIISNTGIVEKQIDMNEQWKTIIELKDIANSYIGKSEARVEQIKIKVDKNLNLNIGDLVDIDKEEFLTKDKYIITDKVITYSKKVKQWEYVLKNTNILENYVDLFRANETQDDEKDYSLITTNYVNEGVNEKYEVVINES